MSDLHSTKQPRHSLDTQMQDTSCSGHMRLCLAVSVVTAVPVSSNVTACHVCCGIAKLWGTMTQATTASTLCIVPLYSMMISVVSVFRSSLTDILAPALTLPAAVSAIAVQLKLKILFFGCWSTTWHRQAG